MVEWRHRGCRCVLLQAFLTPSGWRIELPRVSPSNLLENAYPSWVVDAGPWETKRVRYKGAGVATKLLPLTLNEWPSWGFTLVCEHHSPKEIGAIGVDQLRSDIEAVLVSRKKQPVARVVPDVVA